MVILRHPVTILVTGFIDPNKCNIKARQPLVKTKKTKDENNERGKKKKKKKGSDS